MRRLRELALIAAAAAGLAFGMTTAPQPAQADEVVLVHDHRRHRPPPPRWHRPPPRHYGYGYGPPPRYYRPPPPRVYYPPPPPRYYRPPPVGPYYRY
ncbi:hypothetical protein QMO56_10765 [Roseomonas sp. E05]|uniref:hypothetical protein n=1 Tax=Roseomonas sp. E05 TaxID=3046310 RepID=UPI0024BB3E18|nr:hypothetical protein [Roseomonas sp. E05]MDJ0388592.1 hypothetical protein [Roseomonas sp. E05]